MFALTTVLVALLCFHANADSTSFAKCPHIDPEHNFKMDKMLGTWYAIQKTSTSMSCLSYNITQKEGHPGYYLLTETFPSSSLSKLVGLGHDRHVTGELCVVDPSEPGVMDLKVPLEIGSYKFTVFMTDYINYAAVFSCKTYPLTFSRLSKWSAMILSRTPYLDIDYVEKIRSRLSAYNIDPFSLSIIDQHHCSYGEQGVLIKTASNAINKVSDTVSSFNQDVLRPVVSEAVDSMKNFIEKEKATLKPIIDTRVDAFSSAIDKASNGLNTIFEHPDLYPGYNPNVDNGDNSSPKPYSGNYQN